MTSTLPIASDDALFKLNEALLNALRVYVSSEVDIVFDTPDDPETGVTYPTLSVFLYAVQEDVEQRNGMTRTLTPASGSDPRKVLPGVAHLRCHYLITFWEPEQPAERGARTQAMLVMNQVLNALVNFRALPDLEPAYTRVMEPLELNSLGNFWQALGKKPRLCLNYAATVPLVLSDKDELYAVVQTSELTTQQLPFPPQ